MGDRKPHVTIECELIQDREQSYIVKLASDRTLPIPKSLCDEFDEEDGTISVQEWFAVKEGMV